MTKVVAPFRAITALCFKAMSRARAGASATTASLLCPLRCAISPACGVSSTDCSKRGICSTTSMASASRITGTPDNWRSKCSINSQLPALSSRPGPTSTAELLAAHCINCSTPEASKPPAGVSGSPMTRASGISSASPGASLCAVAMVSLPAPPRPGTQRSRCRQQRRAGNFPATSDDQHLPAVFLVRGIAGLGKRAVAQCKSVECLHDLFQGRLRKMVPTEFRDSARPRHRVERSPACLRQAAAPGNSPGRA